MNNQSAKAVNQQSPHDGAETPASTSPALQASSDGPLFVFTGGGTGGHLFPGLAVAETLLAQVENARVLFLSTGRHVEEQIFKNAEVETELTPQIRLRDAIRHPFRFVTSYLKAKRIAKRIIRELKPAAIIGLGGIASVPLIRLAGGIPVVLLEQNVLPGRTTRWLAKKYPVMMSFQRTADWLPKSANHVLTGNPILESIRNLLTDSSSTGATGTTQKTLLVLGGSQGSRQVNDSVLDAVSKLRDDLSSWTIHHQTGPSESDRVRSAYDELGIGNDVQEFFTDMSSRYQQATLAISRSGATTLAELALAGVPAIFIPFPQARDDHQTLNALHYVDQGAARLIDSHQPLSVGSELRDTLNDLIRTSPDSLQAMRIRMKEQAKPNAAEEVVQAILSQCGSRAMRIVPKQSRKPSSENSDN
jgi:UDP-N-acetylglucosamine--N-acetylmuramyl-(pentapeptide) pyrophosphoryl-undecaprenol N-acetylglucosamine transferase